MKANLARLSILFLLLAVSAEGRQRAGPGAPESERSWGELTPEEQSRVRRRFQKFKRMSAEEKAALRDRHHSLERARKEVLGALSSDEIRRLDRLPPGERERAMRPHVKEYLEQSRRSVLESAGLPEPSYGPRDFEDLRDIRRAVRIRANATLKEFEEDGYLEAGQAERLMRLPPWELRRELHAIQKRHILQNPPRQFLMLPESRRNELIRLGPDAFLRKLHDLRGQPRRGSRTLPALMEDALNDRPRRSRPVPERAMFQALTPEQRREASKLNDPERKRLAIRYLRENAARVLESRGQDPSLLERTRGLPRVEQVRRLIRIINSRQETDRPNRERRGAQRSDRPHGTREQSGRPRGRRPNRTRL